MNLLYLIFKKHWDEQANEKNCFHDMNYKVSGHVYSGPKVVLTGKREQYDTSNNKCESTGKIVTDKLVFTYMY